MGFFNDPLGAKEGPVADFFGKLNTAIDKAPGEYKKVKKKVNRHGKGLATGAGLAGAGLLYKKIQDAKRNKLHESKLKSEKQYYDKLIDKMEQKEKSASAKDKLKNVLKKTNPANWSDEAKGAAKKIGIIAGGGVAARGAADLYGKAKEKLDNKNDQYWQRFVQKYPEYKNKPEAREYFDLMVDTSPDLAKHPVAAKSFMKSSFELTGDINFNNLGDLTRVQRGLNNRTNEADRAMKAIQNVSKPVVNEISGALSGPSREQYNRLRQTVEDLEYGQKTYKNLYQKEKQKNQN